MAKSTRKSDVSGSEGENEQSKSARKQANSSAKSATKDKEHEEDEDEGGSGGEDDEAEEEFEIEKILDAKHGMFPEGRIGYLVKWKGYGEEHNSWVDEDDAGGAQELINEFWRKQAKKSGRKSDVRPAPKPARKSPAKAESDADSAAPAKKRGRPRKSSPVRPASDDEEGGDDAGTRKQKKPRKSTGSAAKPKRGGKAAAADPDAMDEDVSTYADMRKWKDVPSWEHLVQSIDTVERTESGDLLVYFTLSNGKGHGREKSEVCKKKMPYKLIDFYESNLRWKQIDENAMEE
ncbi:hypothetical protein BD413DRAFT_149764 [Trametes elegans]|nr:hypothetical protein BD413DRAFT_149764 [Trametes elegans]